MQHSRYDYWGDSIPGRPADLAYVKQVPPPVEADRKGAKILARTFRPSVYNPSLPTREEVWKDGYVRRQVQMSSQGFMSVVYEPYKSIGHPVHLDSELLVTTTLGLPTKGSSGDSSTADGMLGEGMTQSAQPAPSKYIPRRPRRDLSTLKKEIGEGRSLLQSVKLGNGLFALLRHHWEYKVTRKERALEREHEMAMMSWQRTESDSDSDDYADRATPDDELQADADISRYLLAGTQLNASGQAADPSGVAAADGDHSGGVPFKIRAESQQQPQQHGAADSKSRDDLLNTSDRAQSAPAAAAALGHSGKRRKRQLAARPYTPVHLNIASRTPLPSSTASDSLFNQLCVLHWLLEAMDIPESSMMTPLLTCWSLKEVGGREIKNRKKHDEKKQQREAEFAALMRQGKAKEAASKRGGKISDRKAIQWTLQRGASRADSAGGGTVPPSSSSPRGSIAGIEPLDGLRLDESTASFQRFPEDETSISDQPDDEPTVGGIFNSDAKRPLSSIPESARAILDSRKSGAAASAAVAISTAAATATQIGPDSRRSAMSTAQQQAYNGPNHFQPTREELRQLELAKQLEEIARCENTPMERLSSKMLRFSGLAHAKTSKEVAEFKANCLSNKAESMVSEGRQLWLDVKEEEALKLHDQLEHLDKHRLKNCQSKFLAMTTNASGFHRALSTMRLKSEMWRQEEEKLQNSQKDKHSLYAEWYLDLCTITTVDQRKQWYFNEILEKLKKFGMKYHPEEKTESSSKASEIKFLAVVRSLRTWEICSPDVAAAIEFCRESVIEMAADVYEEFLRREFPSIVRSNVPSATSQRAASANSQEKVIP